MPEQKHKSVLQVEIQYMRRDIEKIANSMEKMERRIDAIGLSKEEVTELKQRVTSLEVWKNERNNVNDARYILRTEVGGLKWAMVVVGGAVLIQIVTNVFNYFQG